MLYNFSSDVAGTHTLLAIQKLSFYYKAVLAVAVLEVADM